MTRYFAGLRGDFQPAVAVSAVSQLLAASAISVASEPAGPAVLGGVR